MTLIDDAATATDLRLSPIGEHEWLIHDGRYAREDPRCLVAFVRADAADVDVVWLGEHRPAGPFASVEAVLHALGG